MYLHTQIRRWLVKQSYAASFSLSLSARNSNMVASQVARSMAKDYLRGFTLIELLFAMAIVAILATIAYPVYIGIEERAKITKDMNNLRQIGIATQLYVNDNNGALPGSNTVRWMSQLHPKYLPSWSIFISPFDPVTNSLAPTRTASEDDTNAAVSYGMNPNAIGISADTIARATGFVLFAPAQDINRLFQGTAGTAAPGVTEYEGTSAPGGLAPGGTQNNQSRINACMADLHIESLQYNPAALWSAFTSDAPEPGSKCPDGTNATVSSHWHADPCP